MDRDKFRVWDIDNEEYIEEDADECFLRPNGNLICMYYVDDGYAGRTEYIENAMIERCIGLKDINDKLIYEGDVVKVCSKSYGTYLTGIMYSDEHCGYILNSFKMPSHNNIQLSMPDRDWDRDHKPCNCDGALYEGYRGLHKRYDVFDDYKLDIEIVGTIHEDLNALGCCE